MKTRALLGAAALTLTASFASAGVTFSDVLAFESDAAPAHLTGFEGLALGGPVTSIDLGDGLVGAVTTNAVENRIEDETDGHGAVAHAGERFWKIRGNTTTIDFGGARLDAFGFWYSDKESATIMVRFDTGDAFELTDRNSGRTTFFGYAAGEGGSFGSVSFEWERGNHDGLGLDGLSASLVPTPGAAALLLPGVALVGARRRR
ncbi:MAG: hypothetical protein AAF356_07570 [Planctomycetota bacterium]